MNIRIRYDSDLDSFCRSFNEKYNVNVQQIVDYAVIFDAPVELATELTQLLYTDIALKELYIMKEI